MALALDRPKTRADFDLAIFAADHGHFPVDGSELSQRADAQWLASGGRIYYVGRNRFPLQRAESFEK
jgi:hypothetical protein